MFQPYILLDGVPVPMSIGTLNDGLTVLDGLSVQWGRSSSLDQPQAATASLTIAIPESQSAAGLDGIQPGQTLEILATDTETIPVARLDFDLRNAVTSIPPTSLTSSQIVFDPTNQDTISIVCLPGKASLTLADPTAWDHIAQLGAGAPGPGMGYSWLLPWGASTQWTRLAIFDPTGKTTGPIPNPRQAWFGIQIIIKNPCPTWARATPTWETSTGKNWETVNRVSPTAPSVILTDPKTVPLTLFSGRLSDADAAWDSRLNRPTVTLTATDILSELANTRAGALPWPVQTPQQRLAAIQAASPVPLTSWIDPTLTSKSVAQEVDSYPVADLLTELATTVGGVLWPASHITSGPYLRIEDPAQRRVLRRVVIPESGPATIQGDDQHLTKIPADSIRRDPLRLRRDVTDLATTVSVTWTEITTDTGETVETQRTETVSDLALIATHGHRSQSVSTNLTNAADAKALAQSILTKSRPEGWQIPTAKIDTDDTPGSLPDQTLRRLLDASSRPGHAFSITNVESWVPGAPTIPAYLEGGNWTHEAGRWVLDLTLSRDPGGVGVIRWSEAPAPMTWDRMTQIPWTDLSTTAA